MSNNITIEPLGSMIDNSLLLAQEKLQEFIIDPDFDQKIQLVFGDNIVRATSLVRELAKPNAFSLPKIELRAGAEINGSQGVFSGSNYTIYLSREFLEQNRKDSGVVVNVILEELGHSIDWKLHPEFDTPGDEGELFSELVRGGELSESELQRIETEDDRVTVTLDGQTLELEQARHVFLSNLPSVTGIYVDSQNNVLVSELIVNSQTFSPESWIIKYNPNAQPITANIFGNTTTIKLAAAPSLGGVIGLRDDGLVFSLNSGTLTGRTLFNIRQIPVDTSNVYNFTYQNLESPGSGIFTQYADYNDIAVRQNGSITELFITGQSSGGTGILPFIMRIRLENNIIQEAKVLIDGVRVQRGGAVSLPAPGIAVNSQGNVITTLPIADYVYTPISLVTFPANFNPVRYEELKSLTDGIDSFGMTTDAQGNFYILANAAPLLGVPLGQAGLIVLPSTLDQVVHVETLGTPSFDGLARGDVAIDPGVQKAYITFNNSVITSSVSGLVPPPSNPPTNTPANDPLAPPPTNTPANDPLAPPPTNTPANDPLAPPPTNIPANDPLTSPVYRFYNAQSKGHFFTISTQERDTVLAQPQWGYTYEEGFGFKASTTPEPGLLEVFRFYNAQSKGHFFTTSPQERDMVLANSQWGYTYESGLGFYTYRLGSSMGSEVYRFYNAESKGHFFTINPGERDTVLAHGEWGYTYEPGFGFEASP